jgi:membrane-bound serine protease (ClpP class)
MPINLTIDPNIAYFLLVVGLWIGATAAYVPGTGLIEVLAGVSLVAAIVLMASLPTNLVGLLILMIGVLGFAIIPFLRIRQAYLALGGLVLQAVGSFTLYNGISVSPLLIVVTLGLPLAYHTLILTPMLARQSRNAIPVTDRDSAIVGMRGRVLEALNPLGAVYVNGETWTAEGRRKLNPGDPIIVIAREGLRLVVDLDKAKRDAMFAMEEDDQPDLSDPNGEITPEIEPS